MSHTITGSLSAVQPFDFARSLAFLGEFPPANRQQVIGDGSLTKAVMIDGQAIVFRVTGSVDGLDYTLFADQPISAERQRAAADRIAFFLSLADDLRPFYALAQADPPFSSVLERLYGYHQVKFLTPFENACWAILSQRIPVRVGLTLKARLGEQVGAALEVDSVSYTAFPDAPRLLERAADLDGMVGNQRKADYLRAAAQAFATVDEAWLRRAPYADVEAWLLAIKGIGAWSANFILIRGLGRMDRVPVTEGRMLDAARKVYGDDLSEQQIIDLGAHYGEYQGYWAHYLRALF